MGYGTAKTSPTAHQSQPTLHVPGTALIACLVVFAVCGPATAQEKPVGELEKLQSAATAARQAAATDPTIKNAQSPPVVAYQIEQKRRRLNSTQSLRQRIEQYAGDKKREDLIPILKQQ